MEFTKQNFIPNKNLAGGPVLNQAHPAFAEIYHNQLINSTLNCRTILGHPYFPEATHFQAAEIGWSAQKKKAVSGSKRPSTVLQTGPEKD
ncbi:MAG TPA: hypothetical protein PKE06_10015 [Flavilitoribacter sp.]|nr:hypothetical protein [Flavilitoribacter sp.]HMQ87477.1 hypothetical protein [Flavilitoribacter sp.]